MRSPWVNCHHVFSVGATNQHRLEHNKAIHTYQRPDRMKWKNLMRHPVDVMLFDEMLQTSPSASPLWFTGLWEDGSLPATYHIFTDKGPVITSDGHSLWVKFFRSRGYHVHVYSICESECGAPCQLDHTVTCIWPETSFPGVQIPKVLGLGLPSRPSSNMLRDYLQPRRVFYPPSFCHPVKDSDNLPLAIGVTPQGQPIYSPEITLPSKAGTWIRTPRGCRQVTIEEWAAMKGLPHDIFPVFTAEKVAGTSSVHLWSVIGDLVTGLTQIHPSPSHPPAPKPSAGPSMTPMPNLRNKPWVWECPDLSLGGLWYQTTHQKLVTAAAGYPKPSDIIREGEVLLDIHRLNYGPEGIHQLVLLWWEWPPEHWEELRVGATMNFLKLPAAHLTQNSRMTPTELETAVDFVDELISLGVLELVPPNETLTNNCPLFLVPKPGQPGQFRCIADMKKGGQNAGCVGDPVQMTSPQIILPLLNEGGFSASLDLAKFFHMFLTVESERNFLGLIHPGTGVHYRYRRLPMGSTNSPGIAGRFGSAFLRLLQAEIPELQGTPVRNDLITILEGRLFHPSWGTGRINTLPSGEPASHVWLHVDDLMLHGPTFDHVSTILSKILDLTVRLGFICNPVKVTAPCQIIKFCGFLYDTTGPPCLRIPQEKVTRSIAQIDYVLRPTSRCLCRLAVAAVTGTLQSLVPATPNAVGANYLTPAYQCLHSLSIADFEGSHARFYASPVDLSPECIDGLLWFRQALLSGLSEQLQLHTLSSLGIAWGDGSGTGAGGTLEWCDPNTGPLPQMDLWMGTWAPTVHRFTSNWRELRTLVASVERIPPASIFRHTILYLTDNLVTYHAVRKGTSASPNLRLLIQRLKQYEMEHHCRVEVIHVPGTTMIRQGTDGLSRGLWVTPLHDTSVNYTAALFRPAPLSTALICWALQELVSYQPSYPSLLLHDFSSWSGSSLLHQHCLWSLSPTFARQGFLAAVFAWIETSTTASHIFIVPRVMQRDFGRVNKHIVFIGQFHTVPVPTDFDPLVPFLLFYLPPFSRVLPQTNITDGMDSPTLTSRPHWVDAQMAELRGL